MADSSEAWYTVTDAPDYEISLRGGVRRIDTKEPAVVTNGCIRLDLRDGGYSLVPLSDLTELLLDASSERALITAVTAADIVAAHPDVLPDIVQDFMEAKGKEVVGE
jgi:hypothetical protein